ncbi:MAG: hypothetical protein ACRDJG_00060, partial [Actinomycetota bacterium]
SPVRRWQLFAWKKAYEWVCTEIKEPGAVRGKEACLPPRLVDPSGLFLGGGKREVPWDYPGRDVWIGRIASEVSKVRMELESRSSLELRVMCTPKAASSDCFYVGLASPNSAKRLVALDDKNEELDDSILGSRSPSKRTKAG